MFIKYFRIHGYLNDLSERLEKLELGSGEVEDRCFSIFIFYILYFIYVFVFRSVERDEMISNWVLTTIEQ